MEGFLDRYEGGRLIGWAWSPEDPDQALWVQATVDGVVRAVACADVFRGDLEAAGKRQGRCGFSLALADVSGLASVQVRTADGLVDLGGGPIEVAPAEPVVQASRWFRPEAGVEGRLDTIGPLVISGWIRRLDAPMRHPRMELVEDGRVLATLQADSWRDDLAELGQGDGRWGFSTPVPDALRDGLNHTFELRLADQGPALLTQPLTATFPPVAPRQNVMRAEPALVAPAVAAGHALADPDAAPELSVIVNFFDMHREAERTLTSLTRGYQRGAETIAYEVICVDNGSTPPMDADWVRGFGPEFRLWRPEQTSASPSAAINAAAGQARGKYLAIMIDGAHLLTPGVLAEAMPVLRAEPRAVVALRHWFIGGDQRWLASVGYTRAQEDILFGRIQWPADGYDLFRIGAPIGESPNTWFDALSESNCLFLPAKVYAELGGMDEGFDEPGGGFVNLDLLRRAAEACEGRVTCLIGEASFHQFHGGTTTNVSDDNKDLLVQGYARNYRALRHTGFEPLATRDLRLAGSIRSKHAVGLRQRPLFPAPLGVTEQVRLGSAQAHFDPGAAIHLQSAYAELGLHRTTTWLGQPVGLAPADLVAIQEIIHQVRPTCIVTTSPDDGLIGFIDSICRMHGLDGAQIIRVAHRRGLGAGPGRASWVIGDPFAAETLAEVERLVGAAEEVLVLFSPPAERGVPLAALEAYARLVSYGSYVVYLGSVFGQPWLGYSTQWHRRAIHCLTERGDRYAVDRSWERHLITSCPWGYIRRVGGLVQLADDGAGLDDLSVFEESYPS